MKRPQRAVLLATVLGAALSAAAQTGAIEFEARITPAAGQPEPVRRLPFYLLRKSFADVRKEVEQSEPAADLDRFIDALTVSKQLKAWMKRTHWVKLSGDEFLKKVTEDDLFAVPEFHDAYLARNAPDVAFGFPTPKYDERDRVRNPKKYEKQRSDYLAALRKYLAANPQSKDGIDLELASIDPSQRWEQDLAARRQRIEHRTMQMAQTRYLAATTETDLNGHGTFQDLASGTYWLSTLEVEADVGEVRLRWDTPVRVSAGQATSIVLSNFNAVQSDRSSR